MSELSELKKKIRNLEQRIRKDKSLWRKIRAWFWNQVIKRLEKRLKKLMS